MTGHSKRTVYIVGPTAVGKSQVALAVAERVRGAIISADSMQVYRGMDIGTAKPTSQERARVRHYLIDIREPCEPFSVAEFQRLARAAVADAIDRGLRPLVVGGTGLYIRALLDEYRFSGDEGDGELRRRLERQVDSEGLTRLYERLLQVDPGAASRIHPHDQRRIIRGLEHHLSTGQPLSATWGDGSHPDRMGELMFGLTMDRVELYRQVDRRVDRMMDQGLLQEVESLVARGCTGRSTAMQAVGYKELLEVLNGEGDLETAVSVIKRNSRRLVRRQYTWFRKDDRIRWLDVSEGQLQGAVDAICRAIGDIGRPSQ